MRSGRYTGRVVLVLWFVCTFPLPAVTQDSVTEPWDRLPEDVRRIIPEDLWPTDIEDVGTDDARREILAVLAQVCDRSPEMHEAMVAWERGATLKKRKRGVLMRYVVENRTTLEMLREVPMDTPIPIRGLKDASDISMSLSRFMYLAHLDVTFRAEDGEYEEAVRRLVELMHFATFLYRSEARSGFYAGSGRWHYQTIGIARRIARHENIPADLLLMLVDAAESTLTDESAKPYLRRNFELLALPVLAGLSVDETVSESIERQVRIWGPKSTTIPGFDLERELGERSRQILALLEGHPNPFDRNATIALILTQYEQAVRMAEGSLTFPDIPSPDYIDEVACWPDEVSLHPLFVFRLALAHGQEGIPQERLQRLQARLATIDNPLGKHLASYLAPWDTLALPLVYSADSRCGIVALAARAYHQRFQRLPASLEQFVEAGILTQIPRAPFGSELRYSRKKRIVWSVGRDGRDDNGRFENLPDSLDLLRFMAPPGVNVPEVKDIESPEADDRATKILLPKIKNRLPVAK